MQSGIQSQPNAPMFNSTPNATSAHTLPPGLSPRHRIALIATVVLTLGLVVGSFAWLGWSGQRGLELGYPKPSVHIEELATKKPHMNEEVKFTAKGTGRDLKFSWAFGDSESGTDGSANRNGQSVSFTFSTPGSHLVMVTATDSTGKKVEDTTNVTVYPPIPVVSFTADTYSFSNTAYFDVDTSQLYSGTDIISCTWDFGDGKTETEDQSYYCRSNSHTYAHSGTYTVKLTVTDAYYQTSEPVTQFVKIG
ncbi:PKD domain-containing protein [Ktedonospora formicarum]|uniref:PKD domain-containing protein n=1 Tax=Ktedonospora formicarum TaxID=2778364 RepID=A0A8J3MRL5_9CHLR|nr:PKD domain-containing protein [Ktedonospora formicarum]GHO46197.1 hypothetical protein KSX_43600 [Ktedonospora formicarum]